MATSLKYLSSYPDDIQHQVRNLIDSEKLKSVLLSRYPEQHNINNDKVLREHVMQFKNQFMKSSAPLSQILFDKKIHVINNALGLHSYVSRVQGSKLKSKNEIRVSTIFQSGPIEFLNMIVVHELAHLREKDHNKAFYKLCQHMLPDYHQLELDMRLYLTQREIGGDIYR